jgi:myo-inositol-1(or 4)-monophosphatase
MEWDNCLQVAIKAAQAGGKCLQKYWGCVTNIQNKNIEGDLVTEADRASESAVINVIKEAFPDHQILAEESGLHEAQDSEFLWAIDPLDGTTNYAHQFPFVAVSIALLYQGLPVVGVVYNPIMNELFHASKGCGAFVNGVKLSVSTIDDLNKSLLATGFPYQRREIEDNNYREFCYMTNCSQGVRRAGAASLDLAYVAAGKLDGYWESHLQLWDVAAGVLLVQETGGIVSAYDGRPLNFMKPQILATNGKLHPIMIQHLHNASQEPVIHFSKHGKEC